MTIRGFAFIKGAAGENSVALWGPIKLGQKVVCFMGPAHKARTKSGLLYGQQISANQGKTPPLLLDLVLCGTQRTIAERKGLTRGGSWVLTFEPAAPVLPLEIPL